MCELLDKTAPLLRICPKKIIIDICSKLATRMCITALFKMVKNWK